MLAKPGDPVRAGDPLLELHADDPARFDAALAALDGGIEVGAGYSAAPLVIDRIG
jgi:thymidine phosphorylase